MTETLVKLKKYLLPSMQFSEVWWFYPSVSSTEIDKYVVYNYSQKIWYVGSLNRTAWMDRGANELPIVASTDGYLHNHETEETW